MSMDHIPYPVWTYDASGTLDYVNSSWTAYTGLDLKETAESTDRSPLLARTGFADSLKRAMREGIAFRREARLQRGLDGEARRHTVCVEPNRAGDGRIVSWIGTAIDIESQRHAESALREREAQYQQERARSTVFQRAVLPPNLPTVPGLAFDAVYEPGLSDEKVGGDWYDAVRLLDGRVLLTIGDVAGSGLGAAVIMGVVRQIMRGIAQLHAEPAVMLDAADRALRLEYPDALVTAWVGVFDLVGRTLTYASAGHPPPLLLEPDGGIRELDHLTLPIGLRQGHQGHASTIAISHGSALWLYTDGLIEATHDIVEGTRRLHDAALRLGAAAGARSAATIRRLVIPNGSPDDVAILVVKADFNEAERHLRRWQFDSADGFGARSARRAFTRSLSDRDFSAVDIANAEIVFGELCGNVARYAPGLVDAVLDQSGLEAVLHVMDRGVGFRHLSRLPQDPYSERGRGLYIIDAMTNEFTVRQRIGGGSEARAVLVGRRPASLLRETLPSVFDQIAESF